MLNRREYVKDLLEERGDALVVSGLGSATFDVAAAGDHPLNFYLWGAMGAAAMVGLGLALSRPDRRVVVFTGDGEMLMGLGSLATIGVKRPENLAIVVLDNQHYGETGMQPSHTRSGISLVDVAIGCRFKEGHSFDDMGSVSEARSLLYSLAGPTIIQARVGTEDLPRVLPERDGAFLVRRFTQHLTSMVEQSR